MLYKKQLLTLVAVLLSARANFSPISYDRQGISTVDTLVRHARKVDPIKSSQQLIKNVDFGRLFKNLHKTRTMEEVRIVSTLGLLSGALRAEESMRENLYHLTDDLLESFNNSTPKDNMKKLVVIEETINRDKSVVQVINNMLKYARNDSTLDDVQKDMLRILKENEDTAKRIEGKKSLIDREASRRSDRKRESTGQLMDGSGLKTTIHQRLYDVREMIDNHVESVHSSVTENVKQTIKHIQSVQKTNKRLTKRPANAHPVKLDPALFAVRRLWDQVAATDAADSDFDVAINYQPETRARQKLEATPRLTKGEEIETNSTTATNRTSRSNRVDTKLDRFKRQNTKTNGKMDMGFMVDIDIDGDNDDEENGKKMKERQDDDENEIEGSSDKDKKMSESQEEMSEEQSSEESPGGIVGLITNLSGGDEGSDVGAVIGALSQVLNNVLGPGGIDIQGLAGTGAALIASLIGGDENFGKVLGNILGLTIEGFSGGGGAANNGQFFGQFIGKFVSILSADPDDEDAPIHPDVFIENIVDGIGKGSAKDTDDDEENSDKNNCNDGGSDSTTFFKSVLQGVLNVVAKLSSSSSATSAHGSVQGSVGSAGGSSQKASGTSSGHSSDHKSYDHDDKDSNSDS